MPRNTRKQFVGKKIENRERARRERNLRTLADELHTRGWLDYDALDMEVFIFDYLNDPPSELTWRLRAS